MTQVISPRKFDSKMYAAALAYYGLPADYNRTFKQKIIVDKTTGEPLCDKNGKPKTTLISCKAAQESFAGNAVWVQINQTFEGAALNGSGEYRYPKKAKNEDIQWIENISSDFEYPPDPSIAYQIGLELAQYLVSQGLAADGLPVEDSGAGCHIVLPIPAIETTPETAKRWNDAVAEVVNTSIKPAFKRLIDQAGIEMDLEGFDISRVLSAPGTWRPYRPDKQDCDALKEGYSRRWLTPYTDDQYPERKECEKLAELIREAYTRLELSATLPNTTPREKRVSTNTGDPLQWITEYATNNPKPDRSTLFYSLVNATYQEFGEDAVYEFDETINKLSGEKYNGRLREEIKRSLARVMQRKPEVIINRQLPEMVKDALNALMLVERDNPTIFVRANRLIKVARDKKQWTPIILEMGTSELRSALSRTAQYYRLKEKDGGLIKVPVTPPKDIVESIVSPEDPSEWPFPVLDAIVSIPVMRPDGTILSTPGYDPQTRLYYQPTPDIANCKIPDQPTQNDARNACTKLLHLIEEFPFTTQADRANALAAIITPFIRQAMNDRDDVPIGVLDAASPGTGKGMLACIIFILATGSRMVALPAPDSEEEWDKKIVTELLEGNTMICIDNISGALQSTKLEIVLTTHIYKGRMLGYSQSVRAENRATWIATGNNVKLAGDLPERCYWVRMVATTSNPEAREFKIPDLMGYVEEHRAELIVAILTMIRAWYIAGKPKDKKLRPFRTFTNWSDTAGSILYYAGVEGFLTDRTTRKNDLDDERKEWTIFLRAWHSRFKGEWITTKEIKQACSTKSDLFAGSGSDAGSDAGSDFLSTLPEEYQEMVKEDKKNFSQVFGKALQARSERRYGDENYYLTRGENNRSNSATWRVFAGSEGSDPYPTQGKTENEKNNNLLDSENHIEDSATHSHHSLQSDVNSAEKNQQKNVEPPVEPLQTQEHFAKSAGSQTSLPADEVTEEGWDEL